VQCFTIGGDISGLDVKKVTFLSVTRDVADTGAGTDKWSDFLMVVDLL